MRPDTEAQPKTRHQTSVDFTIPQTKTNPQRQSVPKEPAPLFPVEPNQNQNNACPRQIKSESSYIPLFNLTMPFKYHSNASLAYMRPLLMVKELFGLWVPGPSTCSSQSL